MVFANSIDKSVNQPPIINPQSLTLTPISSPMKTFRSFFCLIFVCTVYAQTNAQGYLLNEDKVKAFVQSDRFGQHGVVLTKALPYPNMRAFVNDWPSQETWAWHFSKDTIAIVMTINGQPYKVAFKNNIQAYTGLDKSELGNTLVNRLDNTNDGDDEQPFNTIRTAPNDTMYGALYNVSFFSNDIPDYGMGNALQQLWGEYSDGLTAKVWKMLIPQYGFQKDTVTVTTAQLNRALHGERWDFWMGMQEDMLLLYAENAFFDYAHMFFIGANQQETPIVEWHAYIPTDNVRELFIKYVEKPDGRGIEVR